MWTSHKHGKLLKDLRGNWRLAHDMQKSLPKTWQRQKPPRYQNHTLLFHVITNKIVKYHLCTLICLRQKLRFVPWIKYSFILKGIRQWLKLHTEFKRKHHSTTLNDILHSWFLLTCLGTISKPHGPRCGPVLPLTKFLMAEGPLQCPLPSESFHEGCKCNGAACLEWIFPAEWIIKFYC